MGTEGYGPKPASHQHPTPTTNWCMFRTVQTMNPSSKNDDRLHFPIASILCLQKCNNILHGRPWNQHLELHLPFVQADHGWSGGILLGCTSVNKSILSKHNARRSARNAFRAPVYSVHRIDLNTQWGHGFDCGHGELASMARPRTKHN